MYRFRTVEEAKKLVDTFLFVWLVADGWCWLVLREKYCWLIAAGWFVLREKYCWLVADKRQANRAAETLAASTPVRSCLTQF
jgi:hypothetical protein